MQADLYVARKLHEMDRALPAQTKRVVTAADDEAVHDLRVTIRRLRTVLKLARPLYGRFLADAVRGAFAAVQQATGDLRDEEALAETLDKVDKLDLDPPTAAALRSWRDRRRARERLLRRAVVRHLQSGELARARKLLGALTTLPLRPGRRKDLARFALRCAENARREVDSLRGAPTDDVVALHDLRIAYKHLRYSIEVFEGALPADVAAVREPATKFQKRLGDIHDIDVAFDTIARARGLTVAVKAQVRAALAAMRTKKVDAYEREMRPLPDLPLTA
jgi:CHAD domain-containing protein